MKINNTRPIIAASILAADFGRLAQEVKAAERAGADWIHCDIMDGHYVPNISFGPTVVKAVRKATSLPLDVHLMIENPSAYVEEFIQAGADNITVHAEACPHLHREIQHIRECATRLHKKVMASVSLNPHTPLEVLEYVLPDLDMVLLMTVNPGFGGQEFIGACLPKIKALRKKITAQGLNAHVEVDGGITLENAQQVWRAGANVFVAGTTIYGSADYKKTVKALRGKMQGDFET